jgi:hypothetical protein
LQLLQKNEAIGILHSWAFLKPRLSSAAPYDEREL